MPSTWRQAGTALAILGLIAVAVIGLVVGRSDRPDRGYELEQRLRCPVCKSVSIAESPSETAAAMRLAVAEQVAAGRTDQQVIDYFRTRYGNWVLLDPPAAGNTFALWLLPAVAALLGVAVLLTRARGHPVDKPELSAEQRAAVAAAIDRMRASTPADDPS